MKLLLDENLSASHVAFLREEGHDAVSVVEVGLSGQTDAIVRAFAIQTGRVLLTLDADFGDILRFPTAGTPGVIRLRLHPPTEEAVQQQLAKALGILKDQSLEGCLAVSRGDIVRIRS